VGDMEGGVQEERVWGTEWGNQRARRRPNAGGRTYVIIGRMIWVRHIRICVQVLHAEMSGCRVCILKKEHYEVYILFLSAGWGTLVPAC